MTYERLNLSTGSTLKAEHLEHIENGIKNNARCIQTSVDWLSEYGYAQTHIISGNVTFADTAKKYTFESARMRMDTPLTLPIGEGDNWELCFKANWSTGHVLCSDPNATDKCISLGINESNRGIYFVCIPWGNTENTGSIYYNYGFPVVPADVLNIDNTYCLKWDGKEFLLSINNGTDIHLTITNWMQNNQVTVDPIVASQEVKKFMTALNGSEVFMISSVGRYSHPFTGELSYIKAIGHNTPTYTSLPVHTLHDKRICWLGSSVFYGHLTGGKSFIELINMHSANSASNKQTVSGTTLAVQSGLTNSYVERYANFDIANADALVVQLSTNDFSKNLPVGTVSTDTTSSNMDTSTICGAIEYLISTSKEVNPNIKIAFVACPVLSTWGAYTRYGDFIKNQMAAIVDKWKIKLIDIYSYTPADSSRAVIDTSSTTGYYGDAIHPNYCGYKALMYPIIASEMIKYFNE